MRAFLARWVLVATTVAFVLLGRSTEQPCAQYAESAEHAQQAEHVGTSDVSLLSARHTATVVRVAQPRLEHCTAPQWSGLLLLGHPDGCLAGRERSAPTGPGTPAASARGPPAVA